MPNVADLMLRAECLQFVSGSELFSWKEKGLKLNLKSCEIKKYEEMKLPHRGNLINKLLSMRFPWP